MNQLTLLKLKTSVTLEDEEDLHNIIMKRLGLLLLKMECIFNVSKTCIDDLVEDLSFLTASASGPLIKKIVLRTLRKQFVLLKIQWSQKWLKTFASLTLFVLLLEWMGL